MVKSSKLHFSSEASLNCVLRSQSNDEYPIPLFKRLHIMIGSRNYLFAAEAWFDGCMEDRNLGSTTTSKINRKYKSLMKEEYKISKVDKANYIESVTTAQYGITWIAMLENKSSGNSVKTKSK